MLKTNMSVIGWVQEVALLTKPDRIIWCDGSSAEMEALLDQLVQAGTLTKLDEKLRPNSYLARTNPTDVARVESRTFICSASEADAGPTNNWFDPAQMKAKLKKLFDGSMRGRTMYVVPFSMGPIDSPLARYGVEITDSAYVVVSMHRMTRVSSAVLDKITAGANWVPALHSVGAPLVTNSGEQLQDYSWPCNDEKYIAHFPDTSEIWSFGSGYGGNALLGKKCMALRIGSVLAKKEGWLAEHMLLIALTSPLGKKYHILAAFPSACGKTNMAMMNPTLPGWRVETLGDDIAWIAPDSSGKLRAINPEAGFFGVAPGTSVKTNAHALQTISSNTIFTNVSLTDEGDVWWEGMTKTKPEHLINWLGHDWTPDSNEDAAHPNARFTVDATECPVLSNDWDHPEGVVVDAIIFGGRRTTNVPLVAQSRSWSHGVLYGAMLSSEQTAAAEGTVGSLRRDPFALLPFCGYNMADYWQHWLDVGSSLKASSLPKIFQVNWFKKDSAGGFLWPGFGDNIRVLDWVVNRLEEKVQAEDSPIGWLPQLTDIQTKGLEITESAMQELVAVDPNRWLAEVSLTEDFFETFGTKLPAQLSQELAEVKSRLEHNRAV
ncbi:MAG: phosphoenolpyruvate carboxykinase (GTP) [Actinomycetes bacterium]